MTTVAHQIRCRVETVDKLAVLSHLFGGCCACGLIFLVTDPRQILNCPSGKCLKNRFLVNVQSNKGGIRGDFYDSHTVDSSEIRRENHLRCRKPVVNNGIFSTWDV